MVIEMGEHKNNIDLEELLKVGKYYPIKCNVNTKNGPKYFEELIYKGKIGRSYVFSTDDCDIQWGITFSETEVREMLLRIILEEAKFYFD